MATSDRLVENADRVRGFIQKHSIRLFEDSEDSKVLVLCFWVN